MGSIRVQRPRPLAPRFWAKVNVPDHAPGTCWTWTGATTEQGYGLIAFEGRNITAHRAAWYLAEGVFPQAKCVCHHCDVRLCVRRDHLYLGTRTTNSADKVRRGRNLRAGDATRAEWDEEPPWLANALSEEAMLGPARVIHII